MIRLWPGYFESCNHFIFHTKHRQKYNHSPVCIWENRDVHETEPRYQNVVEDILLNSKFGHRKYGDNDGKCFEYARINLKRTNGQTKKPHSHETFQRQT